jgi:membrane protein implicated in regulation of membrane protease activity
MRNSLLFAAFLLLLVIELMLLPFSLLTICVTSVLAVGHRGSLLPTAIMLAVVNLGLILSTVAVGKAAFRATPPDRSTPSA